MKTSTLLVPLLASIALAACSRKPPAPTSSGSWQARLDAAVAITHSSTRDEALAALAEAAAEAKEGRVAADAVGRMTFTGAKDEAAEKAAVILARRCETQAARDIAQKITFTGTRDRTLQAIASGK